jgi:hypothetical protein
MEFSYLIVEVFANTPLYLEVADQQFISNVPCRAFKSHISSPSPEGSKPYKS